MLQSIIKMHKYIYQYDLQKQRLAHVHRLGSSVGNRHTFPDASSMTTVMTSRFIYTHTRRMEPGRKAA